MLPSEVSVGSVRSKKHLVSCPNHPKAFTFIKGNAMLCLYSFLKIRFQLKYSFINKQTINLKLIMILSKWIFPTIYKLKAPCKVKVRLFINLIFQRKIRKDSKHMVLLSSSLCMEKRIWFYINHSQYQDNSGEEELVVHECKRNIIHGNLVRLSLHWSILIGVTGTNKHGGDTLVVISFEGVDHII